MDFLEKNAEQIAKYNKPLADKILSHIIESDSYRLDYTKCDDLNLYMDEMPVHDEVDPIEQAKTIFNKSYQKGHVHIIYGLGLGYLFQRFLKNTDEKILVYEPNLDVLRITLGLFDFSEALANPKIRIVNDKFHVKSGIEDLKVKDELFTIYFLPFHNFRYKAEIQEFVSDMTAIHGLINVGFKELARQSKTWGLNSISNLNHIHKNDELESLKGQFKNKPAIIASAGPSLIKNIEAIKKHRDNIVLISVGVALKTLLNNGIKPDFTAIIEAGHCLFNVESLDVSDLNFIFPPEVNPMIYDTEYKRVFNYYTENLFTSDWVQEFTQISCSEYINRGTVSITALWSAKMMGCNPIILAGQDLAYVDGKCYAGNAHFGMKCIVDQETGVIDLVPTEIESQKKHIEKLFNTTDKEIINKGIQDFIDLRKKDITKVKSQTGEFIPTSNGYLLFVKHFEELIPDFEGTKLFNCSTGGAQIDGYENAILEDVLAQYAPEKIDVEKIITKATKEYTKPSSIEEKIAFLQSNISKLSDYAQECHKGLTHIKKYNQQFTRTRRITPDLKNIFFKAINIYYAIIGNLYSKNRYIMSMSYEEFTKTEEALKRFDTVRTDDELKILVQTVSDFFTTSKEYATWSIFILKEKIKELNESTATKG